MNPMMSTDCQVDQVIGSAYQVIKYVASNMDTLITLANSLDPLVDDVKVAMESLRRSYAEIGFELLNATFSTGASVVSSSQVLLDRDTGTAYQWTGTLPKTVPQDSTPISSGGIGMGAWQPRNLVYLRDMLASPTGVSMVGGAASAESLAGVQQSALFSEAQSREALRRNCLELGLTLVPGSFEQGGVITSRTDALLYKNQLKVYTWKGSIPSGGKVVLPGSTPQSSGGVSPAGDWVDVGNRSLRNDLHDIAGQSLIGTASYADIRSYSGDLTTISVYGKSNIFDGGHGIFVVDPSDTTSADNGGTILVDSTGKRWKRVFSEKVNLLWFCDRDTSADLSSRISAAIGYCATKGLDLYAPAGVYEHSSTIVLLRHVNVSGDGSCHNPANTAFSGGTIFKYTGTADGWQTNSPMNTSTPIHNTISDVTFWAPNIAIGKAAFADTCGTQLYHERCSFVFNAAGVGLIYDQTEVSGVFNSQFLATGLGSGACIWLVNGSTRTPGADAFFTNRIEVKGCQINPAGTGARGILDDGGIAHSFNNNNFNGGSIQVEFASVNGLSIHDNEMEASSVAIIRGTRGSRDEGSPTVSIRNNAILVSAGVGVDIAPNTCDSLEYTMNQYTVSGGTIDSVVGSADILIAYGNYRRGSGTQPFNNLVTKKSSSVYTLSLVGETTAGNVTFASNSLKVNQVGDTTMISGHLAVSLKGTSVAGALRISGLPRNQSSLDFAGISIPAIGGFTLPAGYTTITGLIPNGASYINLYACGSGQPLLRLDASHISNGFEIFINGVY